MCIFCCTFAAAFEKKQAQMAESVDALVSNTSRFTPVPVRPRLWVQNPLNKFVRRIFYQRIKDIITHKKVMRKT